MKLKVIKNKSDEQQFKAKLKDMPIFVKDFFNHYRQKSIYTRINYLVDITQFLSYLTTYTDEFEGIEIKDLTYNDLNRINLNHIADFLDYIEHYEQIQEYKDDDDNIQQKVITRKNAQYGIRRKTIVIKALYSKLYNVGLSLPDSSDKLVNNLSSLIEAPKIKKIQRYRMDIDDIFAFLETVQNGCGELGSFTDRQKKYIQNSFLIERDLCIFSILTETGIRVSELVNTNIDDINFKESSIIVTRKGGNQEKVYFNYSRDYIINYLNERKKLEEKYPEKLQSNKAFILSSRINRISVRSVEIIVKKYSDLYTNQRVTPHTFRRSFANNVYKKYRDPYLVAKLIGDTVKVTTEIYIDDNTDLQKEAIFNMLEK